MTLRMSIALIALLPLQAAAQTPHREEFDAAYYAWDAGRYVEALEIMERLLAGPSGDEMLEQIARLTGELFQVAEVAPDGQAVRWSPDGRYAVYEIASGTGLETQVVAFTEQGTRSVVRVSGRGLVFSPTSSEVAYIVVPDSPELRTARAEVERRIPPTDRASSRRQREELDRVEAEHSQIVVRDLASGGERRVETGESAIYSLLYGVDGATIYFVGSEPGGADRTDLYAVGGSRPPRRITEAPGRKADPRLVLDGTHVSYTIGSDSVGVIDLATGGAYYMRAQAPVISRDGGTLAFVESERGGTSIKVVSLSRGSEPATLVTAEYPVSLTSSRACAACPELSSIALSPDGRVVAFQAMPREDWELFIVSADGGGARRLTREIQHDLFPQFISNDRLIGLKGEGRHRRAHLYDLTTGDVTWLFHNNTVRTVAPEYEWALSPDGSKLLIVAERDGDTVSPERGVYLLDLTRKVTKQQLLERIRTNLAAEQDLRRRGRRMFEAIESDVASVVATVSTSRIYGYEADLFSFDSKHISQPGNRMAIDYLVAQLRAFGYEPELQWFEPRGQRTANVIATLPGTVHPDITYVVSAHFDSSNRGPGADDNTSATVGLLEAARVLAGKPMPATVKIAFFTGEEAGLLGSREFVRRAVESGENLVGALNNDMVGWAENHRLDNTIRYSNVGIRDAQHAAAFLFSDLITYDAKYYKSTDAHAYYEAYGDIVGGIGSYPILASPHYHQVHDVLETVNHQLVAEVSKATIASIMLLASSPSRIGGLQYERDGNSVELRWTPAPERDVHRYIVAHGPKHDPYRTSIEVTEPRATLRNVSGGSVISVKAVNGRGMEGWDWAGIAVER